MQETGKRWVAIVTYRHEFGPVDVEYFLEELADIHDLIENGPHWDCVIDIRITLNRPAEETADLTVEKSLTI